MDARLRIALAAILGTVLLAGVAAAQGGGDATGLVELINGLIDFLERILELLTSGGN